jgi:hypothetical protein
MTERRKIPRKIAPSEIRVRDLITDRHLGQLVNLNSAGMMLISHQPVESNLIFQLVLELSVPHQGQDRLHLGAESLWCSGANESDHYWSGFRIIDVSLETLELIESLVSFWDTTEEIH